MFNKLKASLGIGGTTVDTVLEHDFVYQGDILRGTINIQGGDADQEIDAITLKLCTEMKVEVDDEVSYETIVLQQIEANSPFTIHAGELKEMPFELELHNETPITALNTENNQCRVWLETSLDIDYAVDAHDRDFIEVRALPTIQRIIEVLESEGFHMEKADVEKGFLQGDCFNSTSGCYQELEFKNNGMFSKREIELSFVLDGSDIHCLSEIDRSFSEDTYRSFTISRHAGDDEIISALTETLQA